MTMSTAKLQTESTPDYDQLWGLSESGTTGVGGWGGGLYHNYDGEETMQKLSSNTDFPNLSRNEGAEQRPNDDDYHNRDADQDYDFLLSRSALIFHCFLGICGSSLHIVN